jgi:membrane protein DedA with SNARE-associated domain
MLKPLIDWYLAALDTHGYALVALLMALESTIVPIPSELVIPPAAHLAATTGKMSLTGVVVAGTLGAWVGASLMYWAARGLGRPLVLKYGRWFTITPDKVARAEAWSARFGPFGVFASRLLPVIRHLIGIPAGIVRLNFVWYSVATLAGSAIWSTVLAWVGVKAGQDAALMAGDLQRIVLWMVGGLVVLGALYWALVHRYMRTPPAA